MRPTAAVAAAAARESLSFSACCKAAKACAHSAANADSATTVLRRTAESESASSAISAAIISGDRAPIRPSASAALLLTRDTNLSRRNGETGCRQPATVRSICGDLPKLLRAMGFRDQTRNLSCVIGFGSELWDRLFGQPRPAELHPFREVPRRVAPCHLPRTVICFFTSPASARISVSN